MSNPNVKTIWVTWSGGVDSTGVIANLLKGGWTVYPVCLKFGPDQYRSREAEARYKLALFFFDRYPHTFKEVMFADGAFLDKFSPDGVEIPRRNKYIIDYMMANYVIPNDGYYIGMGEYIGADTWAVKDHVGAHDCDARYFSAYLLAEYGLSYRFISLADFGESRYKSDRVRLLVDAMGVEGALHTTNCMRDVIQHCGQCYKCIERACAFDEVLIPKGFVDTTIYTCNPREETSYPAYQMQMHGNDVNLQWRNFQIENGDT